MKERIKGVFTKKKIFHFLKMVLFVVALSLILLSLLGTVAHATGLVDDTINAENLYSKYPLSNYQLDFYVDNSWSWLPWNWLDGIGKSVQYGLYCITNFVWTISLYLSNATGYVVQEGESGGKNTSSSETAVYANGNGEETPYVKQELSPRIEGVLVIAEGGDNAVVIENITEAVQALFGVDTHKIKVMKHN